MADNDEVTGAWSMNREKLISAWATKTEKMDSEIKKQGRTYPRVPRLTDWTILILANVKKFQLDEGVNFKFEAVKE